ncbi:MAG: protein translocase subunit SecD [Luteitalea sp.]|nr:protein translocase subunit SecD [Luteitalea sp.]
MWKTLRWKVLIILAVTALAVWAFYPPSQKVKLGLDLRGGVHLVLRVQTDDALRLETQQTAEQLRLVLEKQKIPVKVTAETVTRFRVQGVPSARDGEFRAAADTEAGVSYDRVSRSAGTYAFEMKPNIVQQRRRETVQQSVQTIERRVNELGVTEPTVATQGSENDQIMVQLPGVEDVERAKDIIQATAQLEFKLVQGSPAATEEALLQPHGGKVPENTVVAQGVEGQFYLVDEVPAVAGRELRNARPTLDEYNLPAVSFTLNNEGARKFGDFTGANVNRLLAIVLDGKVQSAATIETRINADGRITGNFTQQEAADLALVLRSGALPADLDYLEQRTVGPTLGADSIRAGVTASLAGLILVALFMLVYYRLSGVNAILALVLNLVILLGFMAYLGAVMTLPGIAGFILTLGIGVDSNVLIFERIKEELATEKAPRYAVAASFDRVFLTILDTHVSSLIAAAFLFQFGTGPIRGFATTLTVGLVSNMFTSLFVSRTLFEIILTSRRQATVSI